MKTITMKAVTGNIGAITEFVDRELEAVDCPMKAQMQIDLAIDELVANVAMYAYTPGTGDVTVSFEFDEAARTVTLTFIDGGIPYDPLQKEDPDVTLPAEKRQIGGLGIFLVRKNMDGMSYRREDGKNILQVQKRI